MTDCCDMDFTNWFTDWQPKSIIYPDIFNEISGEKRIKKSNLALALQRRKKERTFVSQWSDEWGDGEADRNRTTFSWVEMELLPREGQRERKKEKEWAKL